MSHSVTNLRGTEWDYECILSTGSELCGMQGVEKSELLPTAFSFLSFTTDSFPRASMLPRAGQTPHCLEIQSEIFPCHNREKGCGGLLSSHMDTETEKGLVLRPQFFQKETAVPCHWLDAKSQKQNMAFGYSWRDWYSCGEYQLVGRGSS